MGIQDRRDEKKGRTQVSDFEAEEKKEDRIGMGTSSREIWKENEIWT